MAFPSYTYQLANSTTADATQVMQDFNDILNGVKDGTKDHSINALTCAGAAVFNGTVTLGDASADDITWNGSLASSIGIKTTYTYDIGSATLGLRKLYLGASDASAHSINIGAGAVASSYTITLPAAQGAAGSSLKNDGAGACTWGGPDVFIGSAVVADQTTTSATFATLNVTLTFTATRTGKYKIFAALPCLVSSASQRGELEIVGTSGSPTVNFCQTQNVTTIGIINAFPYTIDTLTAGVTYTYTLKGQITGGATLTLSASTATNGVALAAMQIG